MNRLKPCTCGERDYCSADYSVSIRGVISRSAKNLMACGKVRRAIEKTRKVVNHERAIN